MTIESPETWNTTGGPGFGNLTGIAVDAQGFVYAARRCSGKCGYLTEGAGDLMGAILVRDPSGKFVGEWKDVVHETHGIYIGHQGFIWATDIQGVRARPREGRNQHWLGMFRLLSAVRPRAGGQLMTPRLTA